MNYGAFMDSALCSAVRHLHETETLMHIIQDYRKRARRHQRGHEEAEARRLASEAECQELQARMGSAEDEIRALTAELEEEKGTHALVRSEVRAAEARLAEAESSLAIREQEGFKDFRNQLRRLLPDFDLNLLQPGAGVEESEAETEAPAADGAAQEGPAEAPEAAPEAAEAAPEIAEAAPEAAEAAPEIAEAALEAAEAEVGTSIAEEPAVPEVAEDSRAEP
ncbi:cytochrome c1-like [Phoenix dactylifera]|uniref:Cytochrome c1-like n=1 Tax=Phoenix dactylifera TaxID=42345 RepID=A0A8B9A3R6_PHODC|nr:cytochrome c1-like [Phoenix dactylifera]